MNTARVIFFIILTLFCFPLTSCGSSTITITVLDAETKEPIEGAVAIAYWNQTKGIPGMTRTETVKIVETVSDKDGKFTIPAVSISIFADKPHLKIYKFSYVGWDSQFIYLGHKSYDVMQPELNKKYDFKWKNQSIYLEKYPKQFSYISHGSYLARELPTSEDYRKSGAANLFWQALEKEVPFRVNERNELDKVHP